MFWVASLQIISKTFYAKFSKINTKSGFLVKNTQIQKSNWLNWNPNEGDITDLKSIVLKKFS